jgi:twinkle protein
MTRNPGAVHSTTPWQALSSSSSSLSLPHATQTHHLASRSVHTNHRNSRHPSHHHHQFQQIRTKVFVSRHNNCLNVTAAGILEYLSNHGVSTSAARSTTSHVILEECPFCTKPTHGKADNQYKLYIQVGGGAYFCHRCGTNGSWYDLKAQVGGYQVATGLSSSPSTTPPRVSSSRVSAEGSGAQRSMGRGGSGSAGSYSSGIGGGVIAGGGSTTAGACLPMPQGKLSACYSSALLDQSSSSSSSKDDDDSANGGEDNTVLRYLLETRGLTRATLRKYGVGRATYNFPTKEGGYQPAECVTFPWIMRGSDVAYQEQLRGAHFPVETSSDNNDDDSTNTTKNRDILPLKPPARRGRKPTKTPIKDTTTHETDDSNNETPLLRPTGKFVTRRIKVRAVAEKSWQRLDPPGGGWGLFGLHTVPDHATEIVLTEGEYDAMAVWQATGIPAVSLPNGCRSLPVQVLPLLERFDKVYLWMDNDAPGQEGAEKFSKKIGLDRSYLVKCSTAKDANEALLKGLDLSRMLQEARPVPHDRILTFSDLRSDVLDEMLNPDRYSGVPLPSLPSFTKLIKGFRRGEMTVLTGPTGSGKVRTCQKRTDSFPRRDSSE